jgi:hypothetical protein
MPWFTHASSDGPASTPAKLPSTKLAILFLLSLRHGLMLSTAERPGAREPAISPFNLDGHPCACR